MKILKPLAGMLAAVAMAGPVVAATLGDDGLHKTPWMRETFKDLREDLAEANALGLRLMVMVEQRGCIYCTRMHEQVFPVPDVEAIIEDTFFVVQINMFGDVEITDFDGTVLPEKDMVRRWSVLFTPTILYFPSEVPDDVTAPEAAAVVVPGAFDHWTTLNMMRWVRDEGYQGEETFQKYHARMLQEAGVLE